MYGSSKIFQAVTSLVVGLVGGHKIGLLIIDCDWFRNYVVIVIERENVERGTSYLKLL